MIEPLARARPGIERKRDDGHIRQDSTVASDWARRFRVRFRRAWMGEPAVELEDVHLSLGRGAARVHILKGISLNIGRGETAALIGPSGSGKSTLLMVMAGLERPDAGSVKVDGTGLGRLGEDVLARFRGARIGIVFQSFHLIPTMTALENVAIPLELAGAAAPFTRARAELAAVGLDDRLGHYPAQLSGGEQERGGRARAFPPRPPRAPPCRLGRSARAFPGAIVGRRAAAGGACTRACPEPGHS